MRQRLTKRVVDGAVAPAKGSQYLWDAEVPGFALRLYRGADGVLRRIYCVRFSSKGRDCWITIGHHGSPGRPDARGNPRTLTAELAREEALRFRGIWQAGGNPRAMRDAGRFAGQAPPRPQCPTLEEFSKTYLELHSDVHKAARSAAEDRGYLDRHILPALGKRRLDDVGPGEVAQLQAALRGKPTTANRCVEVISTMINKAKLWKVLPKSHENPCDDLPSFKETRRERYLTAEDLARLGPALVAAKGENPYGVAALLVLAFTGARPIEILTLKWEQLRIDQALVMLRRKGRWLPLYLPKPAVLILEELERKEGNPYVFPGRITANHVSMGGLHTLWKRVKAAAQLVDVRPYDLRHTLASMALNAGTSLEIIGGLLGHSNPATTKRYAHLAALPVRTAGERVAEEIDAAMGRKS
jgi:integrase